MISFFLTWVKQKGMCDKIQKSSLLGMWESAKKYFLKKLNNIFRFREKTTDSWFYYNANMLLQKMEQNQVPPYEQRCYISHKGLRDHFRSSLMSWSSRVPSTFGLLLCFIKPGTLSSDFYTGKSTSNSNVIGVFWAIQLMPFPFTKGTQNPSFSFQIPLLY